VYCVVVRRDPPTTPTVRVGKLRGHTLPRHESTSTRPASNIGTVISTPSLGREDGMQMWYLMQAIVLNVLQQQMHSSRSGGSKVRHCALLWVWCCV
jgi:hypothetical protein